MCFAAKSAAERSHARRLNKDETEKQEKYMKDPYEILGIGRNATDEQVKEAYRAMARKYHPDNYNDNPLSDLAKEKMQEINDAYDTIMSSRRGRGGGQSGGGFGGSTHFADVRRMISENRLEDARAILDGVPVSGRDAEWYYLNGLVLERRGWFDDAFTSYSNACRLDPKNAEYAAAFNNIKQKRSGGFGGYYGSGNPYNQAGRGCSTCDMCSGLICADCCCEAMGGDLIPCC